MDRLLRPAFGNQELGKLAEDVEGAVPTLAPVLDFVFGNRPEAKERHDPAWWAQQRPRPYRGPTVDPSGPAKKREEYMLKFEMEKARLENEAKAGAKADEEKRGALQDKARNIFEQQSAMEASNQRIGFFGRPAQKQRLLKRERQIERNDREQQAAIFKHLLEDSLSEIEFQNRRIREETSTRSKASGAAASLRAQEKGAIAAATGLVIGGNQLASAREKALAAAQDYGDGAEREENIARHADDEISHAEEILTQEEEKVRACQAQILANKIEARMLVENCFEIECREISSLIEEGLLIDKFLEDLTARVGGVAKGGPAWQQIMSQLKQLKHRKAVINMEKRMFVPLFTQVGGIEAFKYVITQSAKGNAKAQFEMKVRPKKKDYMWVVGKQKPGMVALGKGLIGNLSQRCKVVKQAGAGEFADDKYIKDLPELAISDLFELSTEPGEHNAAEALEVRGDFMGQDGAPLFLSRKMFEEGEVEPSTALDKEMFAKLWSQDWRHETKETMLTCEVKLRYKPPVMWTAGWVNGSKEEKNKFLLSKSSFGGLKKKPLSLTLGPMKMPYQDVILPGMHEEDMPDDILALDKNPRLVGTIHKWLFEYQDDVKEGDLLALVEVENVREQIGPNRSLYVPPATNAKHMEKYQVDLGGDKYKLGDNGKPQDRYLMKVVAPATGKLVGLVLEEGSQVESFSCIAWIDMGEKDWDKCLLPLAEWIAA